MPKRLSFPLKQMFGYLPRRLHTYRKSRLCTLVPVGHGSTGFSLNTTSKRRPQLSRRLYTSTPKNVAYQLIQS